MADQSTLRWHKQTEAWRLNHLPEQRAALLAALDVVEWQLIPEATQRAFKPDDIASRLSDPDAQFRAASVRRRFRMRQLPVYAVGVTGQYIAFDAGDSVDDYRYQSLWLRLETYMICLVSRRAE